MNGNSKAIIIDTTSIMTTDQQVKRNIAILGSTGSIGRQALEVVASYPSVFEVELLTSNKNAELLVEQALLFKQIGRAHV